MTCFFCSDRKLVSVSASIEICLVLVWVVEIHLISVKGSEMTCFCVGVEKYLVLVFGSNFSWFLRRGIEADLRLEWGSDCLDFNGGVEINLNFCARDRTLTLFKCCVRN